MISSDKNEVCCFTGHRPESLPGRGNEADPRISLLLRQLNRAVESAAKSGYTVFLSGMARGADIWAAEAVLNVRRELGQPIRLGCILPFPSQATGWEGHWLKRYHAVIQQADFVHCVEPEYSRTCYFARNQYLVDHSSLLIAVFNGSRGGTAHTVSYAQKKNLRQVLIHPLELMDSPAT